MATESKEVQAIRAFVDASGVPHKVTATLGHYLSPSNPCSPHSPGSYHCKPGTDGPGLAADLAETTPSRDAPGLLAIFAAFGPVESQLAELIYSGAPYSIKNGKRTTVAYGDQNLLAAHHNHVHVAINRGVFLPFPKPITKAEAMARVVEPVAAHHRPGAGPEQFAIMARDGAMYAYNGAPWCGAYNAHPELWGDSAPTGNRAGIDFEWDADGWGWTQYMDDSAFYHWRAEGR